MRAEIAALYCGVSVGWWRAEVAAGRAPTPVYLAPRIPVWLREDLDRWLDERAGRAAACPAANPWDAPPDARRRAPAPRP